jgi:hypothetical protein
MTKIIIPNAANAKIDQGRSIHPFRRSAEASAPPVVPSEGLVARYDFSLANVTTVNDGLVDRVTSVTAIAGDFALPLARQNIGPYHDGVDAVTWDTADTKLFTVNDGAQFPNGAAWSGFIVGKIANLAGSTNNGLFCAINNQSADAQNAGYVTFDGLNGGRLLMFGMNPFEYPTNPSLDEYGIIGLSYGDVGEASHVYGIENSVAGVKGIASTNPLASCVVGSGRRTYVGLTAKECIFWNRALTGAEVSVVIAALRLKWGIT